MTAPCRLCTAGEIIAPAETCDECMGSGHDQDVLDNYFMEGDCYD